MTPKQPTPAAIEAAECFERNARQMEKSAAQLDRHHEAAYAQRLTACAYRQKALLLRGTSSKHIASLKPSEML